MATSSDVGDRLWKIGVRRSSVDIDKLRQCVMIKDGKIGWLSVNFRGTTAYIEVIEYNPPEKENTDYEHCNVVARRDGRVIEMSVYSGVPEIKEGDTVKAGDLIISGIVDSAASGYKLKRAQGKIIAEVVDTIAIKIPYEYEKKVYTGNSKTDKTVIFMGKEIKVLKKSGNVYEKCDIIKSVNKIELFDTVNLPLEISEITYNEYEDKVYRLTQEEAARQAYRVLEDKLTEMASYGDILQKITESVAGEDSYEINAVIYHTEEISRLVPISISDHVKN